MAFTRSSLDTIYVPLSTSWHQRQLPST
jgi:hypothetical protein